MLRNLEALSRFVVITEAGTMRRAAEEVGVTQAALTRSVKLLEEDLGAALFERKARGLRLTFFGIKVLDQARHLLREAQVAETEIRSLKEGETGIIRITAAPAWMSTVLPPVIAQLQREFPRISFELSARNYANALPELKSGYFDAFFGGFQRMEALPSFLDRKAIFPAKLLVIGNEKHPLLSREVIKAGDLVQFRWISFQSDVAYLDAVNETIHRECGKIIEASIHCDSMLAVLELLRCGDYLSLLPSTFLGAAYGRDLVVIETDFEEISFLSGPIYRRSLRNNRAFARMIELADQEVRSLGLKC